MVLVCSNLSEASLDDLIDAAHQDTRDDSPAMNALVARFTPMAHKIASMITAKSAMHDDLVQAAYVALVQAVRRHQAGRVGFHRYAKLYMVGAARRELRRCVSGDVLSLSQPENWKIACQLRACDLPVGVYHWGSGPVAGAIGLLPPSQRKLLTGRYVRDASLEQLAFESNTTKSAVSQRLATAHRAVFAALAA